MTSIFRASLVPAALCSVLLLAACGGGDDAAPGAVAPPAPVPPTAASPTCTAGQPFSVVADTSVPVGRTAGAVLAGCSGPLRDVVWQQTAGPAVALLAARTQAISFDAVTPGVHGFSVSFVDAGGAARSASASINVVPPPAPVTVTARGDQAVRMGGKASVRAWPAAGTGETLSWTQVAGPAVTLDTSDPNRIIFTAPTVSRDTALVFRVTRSGGGGTDSDDVMVLVENHPQAPPGADAYVFSDLHVSRVYPYVAAGPYAGVMVGCVYNAQLQYTGSGTNTCPLATLPFLHTTTAGNVPTVAQIMDRVLVSHDWMGRAFEELLAANQGNADLMRLFNGVTAVVIGAHVRPSFYYALTGAIYLDADNFWRSADERDVIDEAPDFRSSFDRDLQYSGLWRYTANNQSIFLPFPATSRIGRDLAYLLQESGWLLYHELGHASDFLPVALRSALNPALSPWGNIGPRYQARQLPSDQLATTFPLTSAQMFALAQVKFATGPVSDTTLVNGIPYATLRAYTPNEVAGFFAPDLATDEYNYSTTREDITMTFEEVMMSRNHGWRRDVAITDKVTATSTGSTLTVRWGQRGRVGEAAIRPRAQFVVAQLAPWVDAAAVVAALPPPIAMRPGDSWTANLVLSAPPAARASALAAMPRLSAEQDALLLRRALTRQLIGIGAPAGHWTPNERWLRRVER
jgi:hypothetical protein